MRAFSSNPVVLLTIVIIVFISGGLLYIYNPTPIEYGETNPKIACTMEAKLCPDGSYVGRIGPNCEFETCPEPIDTSFGNDTNESTTEAEATQETNLKTILNP